MALPDIKRWWLQRPGREKLMLGACSLGVVLALGDGAGISPAEKRLKKARAAEEQLQARWEQLQSQRKGRTEQDKDLLAQEKELRERLQTAQTQLGVLKRQMGDTALLPEVLRTVVTTMGSTRLLELSFTDDSSGTPATAAAPGGTGGLAALAATVAAAVGTNNNNNANASTNTAAAGTQQVTTADAANTGPAAGSGGAAPRRIYRLPVTLKVSGSWAELNALLKEVETRAPALQWQTLSLDSSEWPDIQLTLRAHVRSLQPRWGAGS